MTRTQEIDTLLRAGGAVVGPDGERIGTLSQVFLDDRTGKPAWVTVHTGLFGISETFVPLGDAAVRDNEIVVPYRASTVVDAPRTVNRDGRLSEADETRLYRYYGLDHGAGSDAPHLRQYVTTEQGTVDDLDRFRTSRRGGL